MKDDIQALVKIYNLVTADELFSALYEESSTTRKTFRRFLDDLEERGAVVKILPEENCLGVEGYICGPNMKTDIKADGEKFLLTCCDISRRNPEDVYLNKVVKRLSAELKGETAALLEKTSSVYEDPKKLEMEYFNLALRYHELRRYFLNYEIDAFNEVKSDLDTCRDLLNNLES